ncbi:MAG: Na+/H+ antiporter subunit C [Burkholderiaceae bacterium]|jgi:multicomponent K+:H+ antiporter subunit C|nr:Na+/H+ antiporter subunit C [Burkholderiaceae bacterium]
MTAPSMELLVATGIGWVVAVGIYLMLRGRSFPVVLGLTLIGYAVNVFIFSMGRLWSGAPPILTGDGAVADPLPQALVLTAIVIGFATTGFVIEMALRSRHEGGSDHVDGRPDASATPPGVAAAGHSAALASDNPPDPRAAAGVGRGAPQEAGR